MTQFVGWNGTSCDASRAAYDGLNRPGCKTYSDGTPGVTYLYDQDTKGTLSSVTTSAGNKTTYTHDKLGRVTSNTQTTQPPSGQSYPYTFSKYTYALTDDATSVTYPSGRTVTYTLDPTGATDWITQVSGTLSSTTTNYASGIGYTAAGGLSQLTLGNGLSESLSWNDQLQQTGVQAAKSGANLLALNFYPCPSNGTACPNNNGNILSQTIAAPGMSTLTQNYTYDNLNRIASVTEMANSATNLSQTFGYDIYGNRWINGRTNLTTSPWEPSYFTAANNRIGNSGWEYDAAGNVTQTPNGQTISYDAEGHQTKFCIGSNCTEYVYDGEGRRVEKIDPGGATHIYVYMQDGQLAAEYDTVAPPQPPCTTCYLTWDHLGSTRLVTDGTGTVVERHDFLPFGEEILVGGASDPRHGVAGYGADMVGLTLKFTGSERDYESQLDFLQARYLASMQGRFLSPDPANAGANLADPQTWNGYAYVGNNPLAYTDLNGQGFWSIFDDIMEGIIFAGLGGIFNGFAEGWVVGLEVTALDAASYFGKNTLPDALALLLGPGALFNVGGIPSAPNLGGVFQGIGGLPSDQPWSEQLPSGIGSTTLGAGVGVPTGTWGSGTWGSGQIGGSVIFSFDRLTPCFGGDALCDASGRIVRTIGLQEDLGAELIGAGLAKGLLNAAESVFNGAVDSAGFKYGGLHPPHHDFPLVGNQSHYQWTFWIKGVKGSGVQFRIPKLW